MLRLQLELDAAHREISRLRRAEDEGNDWDWQDTPEEIAEAMLRSHPANDRRVGALPIKKPWITLAVIVWVAPDPCTERDRSPVATAASQTRGGSSIYSQNGKVSALGLIWGWCR